MELIEESFDAVVRQARQAELMSDDHFTVDGTLIDAWASLKSFRPEGEDRSGDKDQGDPGNRWVDFTVKNAATRPMSRGQIRTAV